MYQPLRAPVQENLTVRGLRHRLTWWGEKRENPVVLLHGLMDCGSTWQFLVDCLPQFESIVAPDWRGFGGSEWSEAGYWFPDYLADLEALLAALVPNQRARVIAHSMGANIATMYAGIRPARLQWLANLEGIGLPRLPAEMAPARYERWLNEIADAPRGSRYDSLAQLADILMTRNPGLTAERAHFVAHAWAKPTAAGEAVQFIFDPRHRIVNPVLYRREEAEACWARMQIPMLLLMAGRSDILPRLADDADVERVRGQYRDIRIVHLPHVGHLMHFEDPESVARHIREFERSLPVP